MKHPHPSVCRRASTRDGSVSYCGAPANEFLCGCAAERERGLELEGVLAAEQTRAAELSSRIAFFGQAYTKVSNKLEGAEKKNKELVSTLTAVQRKSDSLEKQLAGAQAQLIEAQMGGTKEVRNCYCMLFMRSFSAVNPMADWRLS